ncbi:MAG: hypothetical protein AAF720_14200 [Pseudomonadota bacterium]
MADLDRALSDIADIRHQIAAAHLFRGFGPLVIAITGVLSLAVALAQTLFPQLLSFDIDRFFAIWIITAFICIAIIGIEMVARSRRHHGALAADMIQHAVEQFLPAGAAGAALGIVILRHAPDAAWMLPGIWQVLVALGIFAALRRLPRPVAYVGAWYFLSGLFCLMMISETRQLSPWLMGLPFGLGQFLMAGILHVAGRDAQ